MPTIELNETEMGTLMFILANAEFKNGVTWSVMSPLINKIAAQARAQQNQGQRAATMFGEPVVGSNSGRETRDEQR